MKIANPQKIKKAEIIVGIPSYNEAETIGFVVEQVSLGLERYFPDKESVIINLDNNSQDGTKESFFKAKGNISRIYVSTAKNIKGKGYNFHNLFLMAKKLEAKVVLVFDADLRSIQPDWVLKMAEPIIEGYDFVAPYYARLRNDATITNHLVYPLVQGLLGWNLRQPIGGDFAFSKKMADIWLKEKWIKTTYQYGIDIFMTLGALFNRVKACQVVLGSKIHTLSSPKLGQMFFQVTETLFRIISQRLVRIKKINKIKTIAILGGEKLPTLAKTRLGDRSFRKIFLTNLDSSWPLIEKIVSQPVKEKLSQIRQKKQGEIDLELWVKIVYDFLAAYNVSKNKKAIIETLGYLYFGRVASFWKEVADLTPEETEKEVVKQAQYFFEQRDYFLEKKWKIMLELMTEKISHLIKVPSNSYVQKFLKIKSIKAKKKK